MHRKIVPFIIFLTVQSACYSREGPHSPVRVIKKFFNRCPQKEELIKCLKIQALKVVDRATQIKNFNLVDGVSIVGNGKMGKSIQELYLNESKLENVSDDDLDTLLGDRTSKFLDGHNIEVSVPRLIRGSAGRPAEEGRKKRDKEQHGHGLFLGALMAIKATFLAMALKGIAAISGTALILGKIALLLSAILALKSLISDGYEKTTFEIIKQPKYEHIHSSAYEDDYHDHFRRSYVDPTGDIQRRIFRFQIPEQ